MTVQPADTEPENQRARTSDWRHDPNFRTPERVPWSELSPDFIRAWGRADPNDPQPEHMEIVGQNGSGKSHLLCKLLQDRRKARGTGAAVVCTKRADRVFAKLGWPVVGSLREAQDKKLGNFIFWPQTSRTGTQRREFHDQKVSQFLHELWKPNANIIVAFDEIGYVENLSGEAKALVQMYWREARSLGITVTGMKQRPQGALRDMHSETYWTAAFKPKDRADLERWAELFGAKRDWMPVFDSLSRQRREFILGNPVHEEAYISWVDEPLVPDRPKKRGPRWLFGGGSAQS